MYRGHQVGNRVKVFLRNREIGQGVIKRFFNISSRQLDDDCSLEVQGLEVEMDDGKTIIFDDGTDTVGWTWLDMDEEGECTTTAKSAKSS